MVSRRNGSGDGLWMEKGLHWQQRKEVRRGPNLPHPCLLGTTTALSNTSKKTLTAHDCDKKRSCYILYRSDWSFCSGGFKNHLLMLVLSSELAREKMWSRIYITPLLQAEEDRDQVRRYYADQAREKELFGSVSSPYNSDRYGFLCGLGWLRSI